MIVVYGASGRAGAAVAKRLVADGHDVVVAGRDRHRIRRIATSLRVPSRIGSVDDAAAIVDGADLVVNCAGPFIHTAAKLASACTASRYLDISGERQSVRAPSAGARGALGAWARELLAESGAVDIAYAHAGAAFWRPTASALVSFAGEVSLLLDPQSSEYGLAPRAFDFPAPFATGMAVQTRGPEDVLPGVRSWLSVDPGAPSNYVWAAIHSPTVVGGLRGSVAAMWRAIAAASPAQLAPLLPPPGNGELAVVVESASGRRVSVVANDGYAATAEIVALLAKGSPSAREALRALVRADVVRVFRDDRSRRST